LDRTVNSGDRNGSGFRAAGQLGRLGLKNTERRSLMKLNRLIPMLPVRSMPVSVEFYQNMLGFKVERRNDDWGWAMLCFDECRLMVDQSINAHPEAPRQSILYLYPDNVAEYKQVRKNGLAVPELEITFYGLTEFRISDPDGNRLWIGQNTSAGA
jgi:uncharacterized glyoxalase superfamily protein PhnB